MITSDDIKRRLWNGANELRGSMDASRYKDYMLGLMFYKFLSDKTLATFAQSAGLVNETKEAIFTAYFEAYEAYGETLINTFQSQLGYYVLPEYLYQTWLRDIDSGEFEVQKVTDSLNNFERTVATTEDGADFKGLFSTSMIDLTDTALGSDLNQRSKNIKGLILLFSDLDMVDLQQNDILGDAYEYLIGQFAMESGKKAGEFYTPSQVSEVMAQIVAKDKNIKSIYDPTVGSGSLLLTVGKHLSADQQRLIHYYGQEKNTATYNLTRMNLLLHGVKPHKITMKNGDTLGEDWPEDPQRPNEGVLFDAVVMNPPYSQKNWNKADLKVSDPRFEMAGVLPPDSKGDFAFLLHGLYHLDTQGTMAIVLPHGVLFRGGAEGQIRQTLLEKNYIDTIIGLPSSLFTNTGIPVTVIILKKNRNMGEPVLFIDASETFIKEGKQNVLREKDIARIVDTYTTRENIEGFSHLADRQEIVANDYNLNIPRYVEANKETVDHDVDAHLYGGIPKANIDDLTVLNKGAKNVLKQHFKEVRPGYLQLETSIEDLTDQVLNADSVQEKMTEVAEIAGNYVDRYWKQVKAVQDINQLGDIQDEMLMNIKEVLKQVDFLDQYEGYQIIADIWERDLKHDGELIAGGDFYELGRQREPHMVTKGTGNKRRQVQEGWEGVLVPTNLAETTYYQVERQAISDLEGQLADTEQGLADLVEAAKEEDTPEWDALYDVLKKDADDEPKDSFDNPAVKRELKEADKNSAEYPYLKQVSDLTAQKSKVSKQIKDAEKELEEAVQARIPELTNEEIDELVYLKWFGNTKDQLINLVKQPLLDELNILETLNERYSQTIENLDQEIESLTNEFEDLLKDLVVG
ncbi:type I restriction-modification system subunit M [Aerococcaceae bacterium DSM 111022]|nr:type I restriction-modification system subunit M [Aerococcaceae bacterium DSM 111022]